MSGQDEGDLDVLSYFIMVMALLSAVVFGFALLYRSRVSKESRKIENALSSLKKMEGRAQEPQFVEWLAREREGKTTNAGSVPEFQKLLLNLLRANKLKQQGLSQEGVIDHRGAKELPFRISIKQCRVEQLIRFLVKVEEDWPGARIKTINKLDYHERKWRTEVRKGWDATVVISIYRFES